MDAAVKRIAPQAQCYQRRRPEKTLWYRTVQTHFETWLALSGGQGDESTPVYIEQAFRRYLDCGILANGFARAHCDECGHDFLIAFSCKGRGVCPSCNTRRMVEPAADADEVDGVDFHAATGLDAAAIAKVQAQVRQRILRAFVRRGLIGKNDHVEMMSWEHGGGFSLDASVCIGGADRAGLERLPTAPVHPLRWSICTNWMPIT